VASLKVACSFVGAGAPEQIPKSFKVPNEGIEANGNPVLTLSLAIHVLHEGDCELQVIQVEANVVEFPPATFARHVGRLLKAEFAIAGVQAA